MIDKYGNEPELTREELERIGYERVFADSEPIGRVFKKGEPVPESAWKPVPAAQHPWEKELSDQLGERQV